MRARTLMCGGLVIILVVVVIAVIGSSPGPNALSIQFYNGDTPVGAPLILTAFLQLGAWQYNGQTITGFTVTATISTTDVRATGARVIVWCAVYGAGQGGSSSLLANTTIYDTMPVSITPNTAKTFTSPVISLDSLLAGLATSGPVTMHIGGCAGFVTNALQVLAVVYARAPDFTLTQGDPTQGNGYTLTLGGTLGG
jgi:hypothetical protein